MFVCEGDNFIFPWAFDHITLDSTVALTYVKHHKRKIILQKQADSANIELNDPRLRYTTNSIVLHNIVPEDEGRYAFHIHPNRETFHELSLRIHTQHGKIYIYIYFQSMYHPFRY